MNRTATVSPSAIIATMRNCILNASISSFQIGRTTSSPPKPSTPYLRVRIEQLAYRIESAAVESLHVSPHDLLVRFCHASKFNARQPASACRGSGLLLFLRRISDPRPLHLRPWLERVPVGAAFAHDVIDRDAADRQGVGDQ